MDNSDLPVPPDLREDLLRWDPKGSEHRTGLFQEASEISLPWTQRAVWSPFFLPWIYFLLSFHALFHNIVVASEDTAV